jgi:hypothetical protein
MKKVIQIAAVGLIVALQFWGCSDDGGPGFANQAPTVWLSSAPPEGSVRSYTIQLFWGGWDPDGEIAYYEYLITNNETGVFFPADTVSTPGDYKWSRVFANDSTFTFTADLIPDSNAVDFLGGHNAEEFRRSHTFFIRAVDEQGLRSPRPAYRSFTSRTLSPTVFVDIPPPGRGTNPARVPQITTFRWTARDYVGSIEQIQDPDSVRHIIMPIVKYGGWNAALDSLRTNPNLPEWSRWKWYIAPEDSGKEYTSPHLPQASYLFAIQAKDEAGAVSPVFDERRNVRRLAVGPRSNGPILAVFNKFIGRFLTSSSSTPPLIIDLPAGVPMEFEFEASAESYGGVVSGYRYGWDILDLNDPRQWEIDLTPFIGDIAKSPPRTFFFGTHSFFLEVVDNSGFKSRAEVRVNIIPFSMENDLLLVDDWIEASQGWGLSGAVPSDGQHDAFWLDILAGVKGFNPNTDVFELKVAGRNELPITVLARYKNVIWSTAGITSGNRQPVLGELIQFVDPQGTGSTGKTSPNLVALFISAGGHVLITGNQTMLLTINPSTMGGASPKFPMIFRYELTGDQDGTYDGDGNEVGIRGVGEDSFAYDFCCLNVLDVTYAQGVTSTRQADDDQRCPTSTIRPRNRSADTMRRALPLDLTSGGGFPQLDFRPEVSDGTFYSTTGLITDVYNPSYFEDLTDCESVAEMTPQRECVQWIYGNGCQNTSSLVYNTPVAFWTSRFAHRVADVPGAIGARSAVFGFAPVYFNPDQVRDAIKVVVHDEWGLEPTD